MRVFDRLYLDGAWVPSSGAGTIEVESPSTEERVGRVPEGTPADVERAVQAAARAFEGWAGATAPDRARQLERLRDGLAARSEEIAQTITGEVGMPLVLSRTIQ